MCGQQKEITLMACKMYRLSNNTQIKTLVIKIEVTLKYYNKLCHLKVTFIHKIIHIDLSNHKSPLQADLIDSEKNNKVNLYNINISIVI